MVRRQLGLAAGRGSAILLLLTAGVTVSAALLFGGDDLRLAPSDLGVLVTFLVAVVVAEQLRLQLPGRMTTPPLSSAAGLAMAMTLTQPVKTPVTYSARECVAVASVGMLLGWLMRWRSTPGQEQSAVLQDMAVRLFSVSLAALLIRALPLADGRPLVDAMRPWPGWGQALVMLAVSGSVVFAEAPMRATRRAVREHTRWLQATRDEIRTTFGLAAAMAATGTLTAICFPALGVLSVPLMVLPLALTQVAVRRHAAIRETYRQTVQALSLMPEVVGLIPRGHAQRVADLCVAVGRELGMSEREVLELEYAAMLHDIGQVALRDPIPQGATVQAATADQQRIADDGAGIVRETGVLDRVATMLSAQAVPFHRVVERQEHLPLGSRIIKVVNAFDDLAGLHPSRPGDLVGRLAAMERIYLGLGYEYDPDVVEALERVLARTGAAGSPSRSP